MQLRQLLHWETQSRHIRFVTEELERQIAQSLQQCGALTPSKHILRQQSIHMHS